jgi:hypothetical protein
MLSLTRFGAMLDLYRCLVPIQTEQVSRHFAFSHEIHNILLLLTRGWRISPGNELEASFSVATQSGCMFGKGRPAVMKL